MLNSESDKRNQQRKGETMTTAIRTIKVSNGNETRELEIFTRDGDTYLWDKTADLNCDSAQLIVDDSETSVADVLADGFEIAS